MFDSHAHLTSPELVLEAEALVKRALAQGVTQIANICTDQKSLEAGLKLAQHFPQVVTTAATTPHDVAEDGEAFFPLVEQHVSDLVAIGETGLDYFYEHSPKEMQRIFLERYFALATNVGLPLIFHCRDAFPDLFAMADEQYRGSAVLHCFTGTKEEAKGVLDRDWFISFSGIITFKKSDDLREVVKYVPLEQMFVETDSPYLAPQKWRGKRNEPAYIVETVAMVAELKGKSCEEVVRVTAENARKFCALK